MSRGLCALLILAIGAPVGESAVPTPVRHYHEGWHAARCTNRDLASYKLGGVETEPPGLLRQAHKWPLRRPNTDASKCSPVCSGG